MPRCIHCNHFNENNNKVCSKCGQRLKGINLDYFSQNKKVQPSRPIIKAPPLPEQYRSNTQYQSNYNGSNNGRNNKKRKIRSGRLGAIIIGVAILFIAFVFGPAIYGSLTKTDAEKKIEKSLTDKEKKEFEIYVERADDSYDDDDYQSSKKYLNKALKINKESTLARKRYEKTIAKLDKQKIKEATKLSNDYYFEKAIKSLKTVKPKTKYTKEENKFYDDAKNEINYVLLKKGDYLKEQGKLSDAKATYNRMYADSYKYDDGQDRIEEINNPEPSSNSNSTETVVSSKPDEKVEDPQIALNRRIDSTTTVEYWKLQKSPGKYKGQDVYMSGEVYDIQEINNKTLMLLNVGEDDDGKVQTVLAVYPKGTDIKEHDYAEVYGKVIGGYAQDSRYIYDYLGSQYYIYYNNNSNFSQSPILEGFYIYANDKVQ
ncbi:zinc ribbon domain-containing protein [Kurthia sp. Dielmo]|uniref:zinc ribbon domain-containing protein n=1 Tax=Kurthia sp. Dielmo TaxID=1033738 RepID=UPI00111F1061|nr:zinc ribbon domain-containing protein [Kurthia sp. Dielmo]